MVIDLLDRWGNGIRCGAGQGQIEGYLDGEKAFMHSGVFSAIHRLFFGKDCPEMSNITVAIDFEVGSRYDTFFKIMDSKNETLVSFQPSFLINFPPGETLIYSVQVPRNASYRVVISDDGENGLAGNSGGDENGEFRIYEGNQPSNEHLVLLLSLVSRQRLHIRCK